MMLRSAHISLPAPSENPDDAPTVEVLYTVSSGPGENQRLVLFLPFWGGSSATYRQVLSNLEQSFVDATFVALSYSGTGNAPAPSNDTAQQHSIVPCAEQVLKFLRSSELKNMFPAQLDTSHPRGLVLCAHSMSAKIAYVLLSMLESDHDLIHVSDLILLGPAPIGPLILPQEMREQQPKVYDTIGSATWAIQNVLTARELAAEVVNDLAKDCVKMSLGAKAGWIELGMLFDTTEYVLRVREKWPDLRINVVMGESDQVETVDKVTAETIRRLRDFGFACEQQVIIESGHLLPVEASEQVAEIVLSALCLGFQM